MTSNVWTDLLSNIAIPVFGILVPTIIAISLAREERKAQTAERKAAAVQAKAATRRAAIEAAMASMSDLVEAAYTTDVREEAKIRIRVAARLPAIRMDLGHEDEAIMGWVARELTAVSGALNDRPLPPAIWLPKHGEKIVWRSGRFVAALTAWVLGERSNQWFKDDPFVAIDASPTPPVPLDV